MGTSASSKTTRAVEDPLSPSLCSSREIDTPGKSRSTRNALTRSPPTLAMTKKNSAHFAFEIHILVPFKTHLSPYRSARVVRDSASVPLLGSLKQYAPSHSPLVRRGRYLVFCSSVPNQDRATCEMPLVTPIVTLKDAFELKRSRMRAARF